LKIRKSLIAAVLMSAALTAIASNTSTPVTIDTGVLTGVVENDLIVYRGIPYAAPPVGELRWMPPRPAASWEGVRAFEDFGPACPQHARTDRMAVLGKIDEDCLTLNVWAPAGGADRKTPVMVWIHGGAFIQGSGSWPFYDGSELTKQGVVVVTINYRLGRLGFFAHPALTAENPDGPLGNYGLMDQIAALRWVKRNIAAFGGDPGNVTIFGESAGGQSVDYLMVSPLSAHIRDRSPGRRPPIEPQGEKFAADLGISGDDALARLRTLPMEKILGERGRRNLGSGPFIDGTVVPDDIGAVFRRGEQHDVPFLLGANSYEGSLAAVFGITPQMVRAVAGPEADAMWAAYASDGIEDEAVLASTIWGDATFVAGARYLADQMRTVSSPAYLYHFSYVTSGRRGEVPGAVHGGDVPYVFKSLDKLPTLRNKINTLDAVMASLVSAYWVQFSKTGNPNGGGRPNWPAYDAETDDLLELGDEVTVRKGFAKKKMDIFDARYERLAGMSGE
jgi:para-nitrobenzyl esterase